MTWGIHRLAMPERLHWIELTPGGFKHYVQSLRVVDKLEKDGAGLNLSWEVRNGIITHTKGTWAATPEGRIVRMADQYRICQPRYRGRCAGRGAVGGSSAKGLHRCAGTFQIPADRPP